MSTKGLAEFYQEASRDPQLSQQLQAGPRDRESIVPVVLRLGRERGYAFSAEDVAVSLDEVAMSAQPESEREVSGHTIYRPNVDKDEARVVRPACYYFWHSNGFVYRCS